MKGEGLLAVFLVAGCSSAPAAVRTASSEFGCSSNVLVVNELEDDRYRVSGCGRSQSYQCLDDRCWREGWYASHARKRAAREFDCPSSRIAVRWIQEETFRVEACGQAVTYDCGGDVCVPEGAAKPNITVVPVIVR